MTEHQLNVLLAEDDHNLGILLKESLEMRNYSVHLYRDGDEAWSAFNSEDFDLCILDVMMPKKDGFTLATEIRKVDERIPIIFLTAKSMKEDRLEGFKIGADDYLTKPFNMDELELRLKAIMRRINPDQNGKEVQTEFGIGKLTFHYAERRLQVPDEDDVKLTTKEAELLRLLSKHQGKVLERDVALKSIWGNDNYFTGRSMDVYITKLRKYLKPDPSIEIMNIHGVGFKLLVKEGDS